MKNGEMLDYSVFWGSLVHIKRGKDEFLMWPGDRLTLVPVNKPKRVSWLRKLWFRFAPEMWKRYKRYRSCQWFLKKTGQPPDPSFGTEWHLANEKIRVMALPQLGFNEFNELRPSPKARRAAIRASIKLAIEEHRNNPVAVTGETSTKMERTAHT